MHFEEKILEEKRMSTCNVQSSLINAPLSMFSCEPLMPLGMMGNLCGQYGGAHETSVDSKSSFTMTKYSWISMTITLNNDMLTYEEFCE